MIQKWQIVVLSAAVSYGSGLSAMDTAGKKPELRTLLSCSNELRRRQPVEIATLNRSIEMRKEEKKDMRHQGNTPLDFYISGKYYHLMPIDESLILCLHPTK